MIENVSVDLKRISSEMKDELLNILKFWSENTLDEENGGFIGEISFDGDVIPEASKGAVLNTRILWTFSAAYRVLGDKEYKKIADRAYNYIIDNFWDEENGGLYWEIDFQGKPLNNRKQTYAQGFGIYALSEYNRATGHSVSLEYARQLYYTLENKVWDKNYGGYIEAFHKDWSLMNDMRLSEKDLNAPKSMNTHLHILEPYTNLYRVWPDKQLKKSIENLINIFQVNIIDGETGHFNLFFEMDWTVTSNIDSYGHDIEGAWLINEAVIVIKEPFVIKGVEISSMNLVDITLNEGLDSDGGLFYEKEGGHLDTNKHWWPQAEAIVGLFDAWEITKDEKYLKQMEASWEFTKSKIIDTEKGEWYWRVNKDGEPVKDDYKAGFWKCPYHNSRALMEIIERTSK